MEAGKRKIKYVQKSLLPETKPKPMDQLWQEKPSQEVKKQQKQPMKEKTTVINVKVSELRKMGYQSLLEWLQDDRHVYIGRFNHYVPGAEKSEWANPFKVNDYGREGCIQKYKEYLLSTPKMLHAVKNLKGKVLGCWCAPESCHGHILAQLADSQHDQ